MFQNIVNIIVPVKMETRGYVVDKLEYSAACPYCKGGKDRFRVWPNQGATGRFWCRQCKVSGDGSKFVEDFLSDSQHSIVANFTQNIKNLVFSSRKTHNNFLVDKDLWIGRAKEISNFYCGQMIKRHCVVTELKRRRIAISSIRQFRLGYVANSVYENAIDWGYLNGGDLNSKICIPAGILIPRYIDGVLVGLKVRMSEPRDGRRYHLVRGSYPGPILLSGNDKNVLCVVESELDGILLSQECGDLVDVCVLGSASAKISQKSDIDLCRYAKVLVCLDNDQAGYKAYHFYWKMLHGNTIFWAPEMGKDIGEASKLGCDVRKWIEAGVSYESLLSRH